MVDDTLTRASVFRVGLGVDGSVVASESRSRPSHSCGGWVCDLGVVVVSLIFGLVRGVGGFTTVVPTFVLVSRMQFAQRYRDNECRCDERLKTKVEESTRLACTVLHDKTN